MYPAIEDHGVIGNLRTAALISTDGVIDFFCPLRFDHPTVFASLLDDERGGFCSIQPTLTQYRCKQVYVSDTNVLTTYFLTAEGIAEVTDFMPLDAPAAQSVIVRRVTVTRGAVELKFECSPAFNYASEGHRATRTQDGVLFDGSGDAALLLQAEVDCVVAGGAARAEFRLTAGEAVTFALTYSGDGSWPLVWPVSAGARLHEETVRYWRRWVAQCRYRGRWREMVVRSALALKLLTHEPTGAIVAAPTFGLPEAIRGVRNWDYRYTWLRDAAMTLHAFLQLGYRSEALQFMLWLKAIASSEEFTGELQIMYGVAGERELTERELTSLGGYRGSRPVRIGNAAHVQLQLDVYGALLSAALVEVGAGMMFEFERWGKVRAVLAALQGSWRTPDHGLWEIRGVPRSFLHSRLMCWVAFDRAIKIARLRSLPAPLQEWLDARDEIYESIHSDFWNERLQSFVQSPGTEELDASILLMPQLEFISPSDPRWVSTLGAISSRLAQDTAVMRYDTGTGVDGLPGDEGAFTPCSFWYVHALAVTGEVARAREMFEKLLACANHLGLYAEELGVGGEHLGNFPQALTHLALIQCALTLDEALEAAEPERRAG